MSAEPGRKVAYSTDLRWRIVWKRLALEMTFKEISNRLHISVSTAHSIYKQFERTGSVEASKSRERHECRKLDCFHELLIIALVAENPCMSLHEICMQIEEATGLVVAGSTVCRVLKRNGYTRKRVRTIAKQRSLEYRAWFRAQAYQFAADYFIWVDETGSDARNHIRRYGYALRGITPTYHRMIFRGRRISAITAISNDGLVGVQLTYGTVTGDVFADFVRGTLIPEMESFDGTPKKSIVIMDNCSVHHVHAVRDLFDSSGIIVLFLPPYSPDLNPIESAFSCVKYYLKEHDELLQTIPDPFPVMYSSFQDTITSEKCKNWIKDCGY